MKLSAEFNTVELVAETDDEMEFLQSMIECVGYGGRLEARPGDSDTKGTAIILDGDPAAIQ